MVPPGAPAATQSLEFAEYFLALQAEDGSEPLASADIPTQAHWQEWCEGVLAAPSIEIEQKTKSGKLKQVNLRDRLYELAWCAPEQLSESVRTALQVTPETTVFRYVGSCRNDGTLLRPENLVYMLEAIAARPLQLIRAHRAELRLGDPAEQPI